VSERVDLKPHHEHCFGCGPGNPAGLGLRFARAGDRIHASLRLEPKHQGAPGFAHGGVIAAALDDTVGTLLLVLRKPAVTAKLEIDYRRPAFIGRDYQLEAWTEGVDGRKLHLRGELREPDGTVVAEARALFLTVELAHFAEGGGQWPPEVAEHWREAADPELPY